MSQRKAKVMNRSNKGFQIPALSLQDEHGRDIANPTPYQYRLAILQLLEATGAMVLKVKIDGHLCAFVSAAPDEIPDAECDTYHRHLIEAMKLFADAVQEGRTTVGPINSQGGVG